MTRLTIAAGCLTAVLALAACGSSGNGGGGGNSGTADPSASMSMSMPAAAPGSGSGSSAVASSDTLTIKNFAYSGHLTVKAVEKVSVVNMDSAAHTVTDKGGKFDSGTIAGNGGTGTFTAPTTPGKYPFGCTFHPNMAGTLTVTA